MPIRGSAAPRRRHVAAGVGGIVIGPVAAVGPALALIALALVAVALVTGCATSTPGSGTAERGEVSAYRSEVSAAASASARADVRVDAVALCRQAMSSMGAMVSAYNDFIVKLNAVHSYDGVGALDEQARAALIAGSDQIRASLTPRVPGDVTAPVQRFLARTQRLGRAISQRERTGLNPVADQWTRAKGAVLTACAHYVPDPPGLGSGSPTAPASPSTRSSR
ncbi:MAG: hypothetical protein QM662_18805 [Gordonia sp. (in: high G+C Gram-positive bacteria)]